MKNNFIGLFLLFLIGNATSLSAQILNADAFGRPVDSTHKVKGAVDFGMTINKQNTLLVAFDTKADLSYWHFNNVLITTNTYSLFRTGSNNLINGGFSHLRYRFHVNRKVQPEVFMQYQLDNIRGMKERFLLGANARLRIFEKQEGAFFTGIGMMYESEKWDYSGIRPDAVPLSDTIRNNFLKFNCYLSYKHKLNDHVSLNMVLYFQSRPDSYFIYPRLASEARLNFRITKHISFSVNYNVSHDALPPVPIFKWYYSVINRIVFTF